MALPLPPKKIIYCNGLSTEIIKDKFVKLLSKHCGKTINRLNDTLFWNTADLMYMPELMIDCLLAEDERFALSRKEIPYI
jgi:hypothetical protein